MRIFVDAHLALLSEGRLTMQVPDMVIGSPQPGTIDYPDEYFVYAKIVGHNSKGTRYRVAVGREEGFLYLSRRGFEHFKPALKRAFNSQCNRGGTWQDVEDYADKFFMNLNNESSAHLIRLQAEVRIKNTPYNQKRVNQMTDALRNIW